MEKIKNIITGICLFFTVTTIPGVYICFHNYMLEHCEPENKTETTILIYLCIISHIIVAKWLYDEHRKEVDKYRFNNAEGGKDRP